ncbi:MAG: NUDIX domain-containing protein [Desulfobulbaceae bacterium]|uniref:NUDIX domain-containing protein n=1 Tax=Candidatus Desulfatifera sulfidica TaxID=2841691 RepID=A0A8J6N9I2_9BACT|nr:NUDIX domain-containing protein [Candidatus Desulfatifera sulfidica]
MTSLSSTEIIQIVDADNQPIDVQPRHEMRRLNLIHRACYILVFNTRGELFLQKRTADKDVYPSCWDVAAGGVVLAGESYEAAATRELEEELGVKDVICTPVFDQYFEDLGNRVWGRIFTCSHDGPFVLQKEEVAHGLFMAVDKILTLGESEAFTPDGIAILRRIHDSSAA